MRWIKRFVICLLMLFTCISVAYASNGDVTVYVTKTGECYHRSNCSYLKSSISISLQDAVNNGYRACTRCNPPSLGSYTGSDTIPYRSPNNNTPKNTNSFSGNTTTQAASSQGSSGEAFGYILLGAGGMYLYSKIKKNHSDRQ